MFANAVRNLRFGTECSLPDGRKIGSPLCGEKRLPPHSFLKELAFAAVVPCPVEFAQGVKPGNYKLFQLADLICTLHLLELKIQNGEPMTLSEFKFFGSPRTFVRNVLRKIKPKEI